MGYKDNYKLIEWTKIEPPKIVHADRVYGHRSDLPTPYFTRDDIPDLMNHADGRRYSSKSSFEKGVKEAGKRDGKEYTILGNEDPKKVFSPPKYDPNGLKQDIKNAIDKHGGM